MKGVIFVLAASALLIARPLVATVPFEIGTASGVTQAFRTTDLLTAKLTLDDAIDPTVDGAAVRKDIALLVAVARQLAGPRASDGAKIDAVRKVLYQSGPWNNHRPFAYDHGDPFGRNIKNKLLSTYLRTRRGNCVSMPILFMIVGRGIGLNLTLTTAPLHVLVRYTRPGIHPFNIESTSGGNFARDEWYRQKFPMSDRAIESGLYLRTHTDKETVAVMASTLVEHLMDAGQYSEAVSVADAILAANPKDGTAMIWKGSAFAMIMKAEFQEKYATPAMIPPNLRQRYLQLAAANEKAFADAETLGWEPTLPR